MAIEVGILLISVILAPIVIYFVWSSKSSAQNSENKFSSHDGKKHQKKTVKSSAKPPQRKNVAAVSSKEPKYSHPWLLTTLKGHTGLIMDIDISPNGKYLATCCEDQMPVSQIVEAKRTETRSEAIVIPISRSSSPNKSIEPYDDEPTPPSETDSGCALSRRQKKNRSKRGVPKPKTDNNRKSPDNQVKESLTPLTKYLTFLKMKSHELYATLSKFVLLKDQLLSLGYPVESAIFPTQAIIYKNPECNYNIYQRNVQSSLKPDVIKEMAEIPYKTKLSKVQDNPKFKANSSLEKQCTRCKTGFKVTNDGEYFNKESCMYHWGQWKRISNESHAYTCCLQEKNAPGCTFGRLHVWNGVNPGINGPFKHFVRTQSSVSRKKLDGGIYALDCEMCYTSRGLEVCKVSVISIDGCLVYETLVKPQRVIIDYNTRFSGLKEQDLKNTTKRISDVQKDLLLFIHAETILIGHGLENDLRALGLIHSNVIDTAVLFPHHHGLPFRRSLKSLTAMYLQRHIQTSDSGHDSLEDALACAELVLWKVATQFKL